jgi:tetratricopeptide (TPR) repeat protein
MRAFIVRPFGPRQGIDFTAVQQRLIDPALAAAGIAGDTTMQFVEAGNIRVDMFEQLLLADLVIADVSVHNANVFYELGIRHALRSRQTILIRAKVTKPRAERTVEDDVPFDLRTDRYLEYDHEHPEASLDELSRYVKETWAGGRTDSPVFLSLPSLAEQDRSRLSPVPRGFLEEAELAFDKKDVVHLGLLAAEAADFTWELEGWRTVGKMQLDLGALTAARRTLERVRKVDPNDLQANLWLGTVYQRLGDFTSSDQALDRVVDHPAATRRHKSEAFALKGSNEKQQWVAGWIALDATERCRAALASPGLQAASEYYERALSQDLNSFYPALVALSLVTIRKELIDRDPAPWKEQFGSEAEEIVARDLMLKKLAALAGTARLALDADLTSEWRAMGMADYQFLVAEKPGQAIAAYRTALKGQAQFKAGAARRQLQMFADLQLKADRIKEILAMFAAPQAPDPPASHVVVFTGHMIDAEGRTPPRFPEKCVPAARDAIRRWLTELKPNLGIAAAACGGDIIFHEVCGELNIPTDVRLVIPPNLFVNTSVAHAGLPWVDRFWALVNTKKQQDRLASLCDTKELPDWLKRKDKYAIWNRANLWMLEYALSKIPQRLTVMALWNGEGGDGPGGTADLLARAKSLEATPLIVSTKTLC